VAAPQEKSSTINFFPDNARKNMTEKKMRKKMWMKESIVDYDTSPNS